MHLKLRIVVQLLQDAAVLHWSRGRGTAGGCQLRCETVEGEGSEDQDRGRSRKARGGDGSREAAEGKAPGKLLGHLAGCQT